VGIYSIERALLTEQESGFFWTYKQVVSAAFRMDYTGQEDRESERTSLSDKKTWSSAHNTST
jgi:hypothetical protein